MADLRYVLAFDTALAGCSVGLRDFKNDQLFTEQLEMARGQAEQLVPMIQRTLQQANVTFQDIDVIGTTIGPGAFTGLRIGMSTAKSLALSLERPLVGCTTLETLACQFFDSQNLKPNEELFVILETKRQDFYFQSFDHDKKPLNKPQACDADEILKQVKSSNKTVVIGNANKRFKGRCDDQDIDFIAGYELIHPESLCQVAYDHYKDSPDLYPAEPLYLRGADVSQSKKTQRILEEI